MPKISINYFAIYYLYYKKKLIIIEFIYNFFLFLSHSKLILPFGILFKYIIKFAIYYLYYKDKFINNLN